MSKMLSNRSLRRITKILSSLSWRRNDNRNNQNRNGDHAYVKNLSSLQRSWQISKKTCPHCHGHKSLMESKTLKINIDKGVQDNHLIEFEGEGDAVVSALPGNVNVIIKIQNDTKFVRKGDDLYTELKIEFQQALFGFNENLKHLDGRYVNLTKNGTSQPQEYMKIVNEGMPKKDNPLEKGDLYVKIMFTLPKRINLAQKKIVKEIFEQLIYYVTLKRNQSGKDISYC